MAQLVASEDETGRACGTSETADVLCDQRTAPGRIARELHEEANPRHRLGVEHDDHTLLVHLSEEDRGGWTTIAVDRATRRWALGSR